MYLLPSHKILNAKTVAVVLSDISKTPCSPAIPPQTGFFLGGCQVSPKGIITLPDDCNAEDADRLCQQLFLEGFSYYSSDKAPLLEDGCNIPVDHDPEDGFTDPRLSRNDGKKYLTLSMDQGSINENDLKKLENLVAGKASLLKKTLEADDLPIIVRNQKIFFPWFTDNGAEGEKQAWLDLIDRLVYHACCSKRITAKDRPCANETRQMGIFLTSIGMSAEKYPRSRQLLLRNLNNSSSEQDYLNNDPSERKYLPAPRIYLCGQSLIND